MRKKIDSGNNTLSLQDLQCQLSDTRLKIALLQAAGIENGAEGNPDAMAQVTPNEKTLAAIRRETRRLERLSLLHRMPVALKAAAAILLISFLTLSTAMAVSPAGRVAVMKLLYTVTPQYTEISLVPDEDSAFEVPEGWQGMYYPAYIPEGYTFFRVQSSFASNVVTYISGADKIFWYDENDKTMGINLDTENAEMREISLNGTKALLTYKKDGFSTIVWHQGDLIVMISITESPQTAIEIAQSLIRIR